MQVLPVQIAMEQKEAVDVLSVPSMGSGDSILCFDDSLQKQYQEGLKRMQNKWPDCIGFAYFQSYSNTYAPLETLKKYMIHSLKIQTFVELRLRLVPIV